MRPSSPVLFKWTLSPSLGLSPSITFNRPPPSTRTYPPGYTGLLPVLGWEMVVRIEKILCTVPDEAHRRQVEETTEALGEGPEEFYRNPLD